MRIVKYINSFVSFIFLSFRKKSWLIYFQFFFEICNWNNNNCKFWKISNSNHCSCDFFDTIIFRNDDFLLASDIDFDEFFSVFFSIQNNCSRRVLIRHNCNKFVRYFFDVCQICRFFNFFKFDFINEFLFFIKIKVFVVFILINLSMFWLRFIFSFNSRLFHDWQ